MKVRGIKALVFAMLAPFFAAANGAWLDFAADDALSNARGNGAELAIVSNEFGPALRVSTRASDRWPGAVFDHPDGVDWSAHGELVFSVKNKDPRALRVHCQIQSRGNGNAKPVVRKWSVLVETDRENTFRIPLTPIGEGENSVDPSLFFGLRGKPFLNTNPMHLDRITKVSVFVVSEGKPHVFEIGNIMLEGAPYDAARVPREPFPLIDEFGQFIHKDWPFKIKSFKELGLRREQEERYLEQMNAPAEWNQYGGWKNGPLLEATGFFRTEKVAGKWALIDPEGRLFFSLGINCVGHNGHTTLDDREHWFAKLPPDDAKNRENGLYRNYRSHMPNYYYGNRGVRVFNFRKQNLMWKYGADWETVFYDASTRRLPAWGVNTIAAWSDPRAWTFNRVAYTAIVSPGRSKDIEGSEGYWGRFKDVFDPSFKQAVAARFGQKQIRETINDPWCIGYFVGNEITWGDETALALAVLRSPPEQAAKNAFLADLRGKYETISALNAAWKTEHASWEALLNATETPDENAAEADLLAFNERVVRVYFKTVRDAVKAAAPNQLYLGCRLAWSNPMVSRVAGEYCDVVSFNAYARELPTKFSMFAEAGDVPCMIGEFHFGALDRGQLHPGLIPVKDQDERAVAFTRYVEDALRHPNLVGCHWFQYADSPTTGRCLDGENYQIGFTDTCDTPYPELVKASRSVGERMYAIRHATEKD